MHAYNSETHLSENMIVCSTQKKSMSLDNPEDYIFLVEQIVMPPYQLLLKQ